MVIQVEALSKTYKRFKKPEGLTGSIRSLLKREYVEKKAVDGICFQVEEGEFVGLIGPNGAGKTTLVKMLTGIIAPTAGKIEVLGCYPNDLKDSFKKQYAVVMGQKSQLFLELTTNDTLQLMKEMYEIPQKTYQRNRDMFVELFAVQELMDVQVRTLSLGERMKMELIAALLHDPKVLFLDEPTIGLDMTASRQVREFLKQVNKEKQTTIMLTSHYMEDIRELCSRSIVIGHGELQYDGTTEALFHHNKIQRIYEGGRKNMRKYLEISKLYMKMQMIWRSEVVTLLLVTVMRILFAAILWGLIFQTNERVSGFTYPAMMSYYIFQAFFQQMDFSREISTKVSEEIRNGMFSKYITVPVNIERYFLFMSIGKSIFCFIFQILLSGACILLMRIPVVITSDIGMIGGAVVMTLLGRNAGEMTTGIVTIGLWCLAFAGLNRIMFRYLRKHYDGVGI